MSYDVVYDATRGPYEFWWLPVLPLGMAGFFFTMRRYSPRKPVSTRIGIAFALVISGVVAAVVISNGSQLRRAMESGAHGVVEGTVTDFIAGDPYGHRPESFWVRNDSEAVHFEYDPAWITPGYHRIEPSGGIFHAGLRVRVAYVNQPVGVAIARVEIARR